MSPTDGLRLGLVADVQYADRDDVRETRYRESLARLDRALHALREAGAAELLQLGDVVDGYLDLELGEAGRERARQDLESVLAVFARHGLPLTSLPGNHGLAVGRQHLVRRLGMGRVAPRDLTQPASTGPERGAPEPWHAEAPTWRRRDAGGVRLLLLDTVRVSALGRAPEDPVAAEAATYLADAGPEHPERTDWNGALGADQRRWLAEQLAEATADRTPVLVLAHHPLLAEASDPRFPAWDAAQVLELLDAHPGVVRAWVNGHYHRGGRVRRAGVEHLSLRGLVRAGEPEAWALLELGHAGPGTWCLHGPAVPGGRAEGGPDPPHDVVDPRAGA